MVTFQDIQSKIQNNGWTSETQDDGTVKIKNNDGNLEYTLQQDGSGGIIYEGITTDTLGAITDWDDISSLGTNNDAIPAEPAPESVQTAVWKQYMATSNPDLAAAAAFWKIFRDDSNVKDSPYMLGLGALQTAYALVGRQGLAQIVQGLGAGLWHVLATPMRQPQYKPDG